MNIEQLATRFCYKLSILLAPKTVLVRDPSKSIDTHYVYVIPNNKDIKVRFQKLEDRKTKIICEMYLVGSGNELDFTPIQIIFSQDNHKSLSIHFSNHLELEYSNDYLEIVMYKLLLDWLNNTETNELIVL